MRPLIGITAYSRIREGYGWLYNVSYSKNSRAIEQAGGLPVLIPADVSQETLRGLYDRLDGVLLPGGGDIAPTAYHAPEKHKTVSGVDTQRDVSELLMTRWAINDDLPVFGICRGIQVMNVALGGTLIQDIPTHINTDLTHDIPKSQPRSTLLHDVTIESGTRLADILGETTVTVNSLHHQALQDLASGFEITATAPDGIIEAIEMPDKTFVLAVQWHPEDIYEDDVRMMRLFESFVESARKRLIQKQSGYHRIGGD